MKKSLSHLPKHKSGELPLTVSIIREAVKVEKIILFGSYARGDWVEDEYMEGRVVYEYTSDFDLLVVVEKCATAHSGQLWSMVEDRISGDRRIRTPVSLIAHDIHEINKKLLKGHYFFTDVVSEGVLLYDSGKYKFARKKKLNAKERKGNALAYFRQWFKSAHVAYKHYQYAVNDKDLNMAAFMLHQSAENLFAAILLVFTNYKPKTHDLAKLNKRAACCDVRLKKIFPSKTEWERDCFSLLRRAYVEARYNHAYKITKPELEYLAGRIRKLQRLTKRICAAKIESFT